MKRIEEYITEKFKINKNIESNNNVFKYFLDLDFYDIKENSAYGDMSYTLNDMNEMYWDSPKDMIDGIKEHIDEDVNRYSTEADDYSIPIYCVQEREYDSKILVEDEDYEEGKYHFGSDSSDAEIKDKRKLIASYVSKEYLKETEDYWKTDDLDYNNILDTMQKHYKGKLEWL